MNGEVQSGIDAGKRSVIAQLQRRGESVERISTICHVPAMEVERILDRMVRLACFD